MINIILHGCNGHMGRMICDTAAEETGIRIAAGVDVDTAVHYDFPVFEHMSDISGVEAVWLSVMSSSSPAKITS